jgi:hypothetical protein
VIKIDGHSHGETKTKMNDQKGTEFLKLRDNAKTFYQCRNRKKYRWGVIARLEEFIAKERKLDVNQSSPL